MRTTLYALMEKNRIARALARILIISTNIFRSAIMRKLVKTLEQPPARVSGWFWTIHAWSRDSNPDLEATSTQ